METYLEVMLKKLLEEFTKYEIQMALERLTAAQSLEEIRLMKHIDKVVE